MAEVKDRAEQFIRTCEELLVSSHTRVREEVTVTVLHQNFFKVALIYSFMYMYYVGVTCLRLQAFISICDLLIVFSRHLATTAPQLDLLIVDPDRNLQGALSHFLSEAVFITEAEGLLPSTRLRVVGHPASSYKLFVFQVRSASCCIVVATSWRASASSSSTTSFPSAWLPTSSSTTCAYVTTHLSLEWTP